MGRNLTCVVRGPTRTARLVYPRGDHITSILQSSGAYYEDDLLAAIRARECTGVYVDVGAHHGNHSAYFALECPSDRVISIEPGERAFEGLQQTIEANAISGKCEAIRAAVHPEWSSVEHEILNEKNSGMARVVEGTGIAARRLDDILLQGPRVGVIKVDAEGLELGVLMSAEGIIERDRPLLAVESASADDLEAVRGFLAGFGYTTGHSYCRTPTYLWEHRAPEAPALEMFEQINIETQEDCSRRCKTCLRQTHPGASRSRARGHQLPTDTIQSIIDQAADMDFRGRLCLQFFNEPLLDPRLADLARYARKRGSFSFIYVNTNADELTGEKAAELDGLLDGINVSVYGCGEKKRAQRERHIASLFDRTSVSFTHGVHVVTHYSPFTNLMECIRSRMSEPCLVEVRRRMIISHTGEMLLCCEDIAGEWGLGSVEDSTLEELWYGPKHEQIASHLARAGGRGRYVYCSICPR